MYSFKVLVSDDLSDDVQNRKIIETKTISSIADLSKNLSNMKAVNEIHFLYLYTKEVVLYRDKGSRTIHFRKL